jgi:hypothetical protein
MSARGLPLRQGPEVDHMSPSAGTRGAREERVRPEDACYCPWRAVTEGRIKVSVKRYRYVCAVN